MSSETQLKGKLSYREYVCFPQMGGGTRSSMESTS